MKALFRSICCTLAIGAIVPTAAQMYKQVDLGDGTTTNRYSPVPIMTGVQSIAAGESHTLIIKTDGTLWGCGYNNSGQLGNGTIINRHSPIRIPLYNFR